MTPPVSAIGAVAGAEVRVLPSYVTILPPDGALADGLNGEVDLSAWLPRPNAGSLAVARQTLFEQVFVDRGAVTWPGELDLAPDAMVRCCQAVR